MVLVSIEVNNKNESLYVDGELYNQLINNVQPSVKKKDFDYVMIIDGEEGAGKSVFAFQIAKILDTNFDLNNVCFTPNDFIRLVTHAKPHSCIVFDEAFTGLSSRSALSEVNQLLVSLMMEMRQKNLFIILVMPTIFMLDKYAVLHRAKCMFHIYMRNKQRGYWKLFTKRRMKNLYLKGKKYYEYDHETAFIFGKFTNKYTIDEKKYRELKRLSLNKKKRQTKSEVFKTQRDSLFYILFNDLGLSQTRIVKLCRKRNYPIAQSTLSEIITDVHRFYLTDNQVSEKEAENLAK